MSQEVKHELDARGLLCPEPVMMLHKVMRQLQGGETVVGLCNRPLNPT